MINLNSTTYRLTLILKTVLNLAVLTVFFAGPTYARFTGNWLPPNYEGVFAIIVPIYITIVVWLLLGLPGLNESLRDSRRWWMFGLLALVVWAWLSRNWSLFPDISITKAGAFATISLFAWAVICAGPSPRQVCLVLAAGLFVQAVISIIQVAIQRPLGLTFLGEYEVAPLNVGLSIVVAEGERLMRPYGLAHHPNTLGGYVAFALLSLSAWLGSDSKRLRYVGLGVFALGLWCLWLSFSRAAWGAFIVGLLALCAMWWRKRFATFPRSRLVIVAVTGILVSAVFFLTYSHFILARTIIGDEITELRSISDRRYYTGIALQAIYEHPIIGIGLGAFPDFAGEVIGKGPYAGYLPGDHVHNVPLLVLSELGVIGLTIWLITLFAWFIVVWNKVRDPFAIGIASGVIALLATGLLDHYTWSMPHFVIMVWAGMGLSLKDVIAVTDTTNSSAGDNPAEPRR